jgi:hypothetical protein
VNSITKQAYIVHFIRVVFILKMVYNDILSLLKGIFMQPIFRFKYILKKKCTDEHHPEWLHYKKHWKLQVAQELDTKGEAIWTSVPDVFVIENDDGDDIEISREEYLKLIEKNRVK